MPGRRTIGIVVAGGLLVAFAAPAMAQTAESKVNSGDTAWVLISAGLVMLMTPGLAFFYGGLVRRKNVLSVLMQCFMALCLVSVQWVLIGYSLSFAPGGALLGSMQWAGCSMIDGTPNVTYAATIPHSTFMVFQMMFAVITPALIAGAFAERMKFSSYCLFILLWTTLVYDPVAHWVWGTDGFLNKMGALDFAGGTVVHINAGMAALAAAILMGKRQGYPHDVSPPHNLPFAALGAGLLWFGWFGFNGGSALSVGATSGVCLASSAFVVTHVAAAAAGLTWCVLDWIMHRKATTLGMITGVVAGLVSITPAAGYVNVTGALAIGAGAGLLPWLMVTFVKERMGCDDSLDAFSVHGVGGIWGAIATGLWSTRAVNPDKADGLFYGGGAAQLIVQLKAVGVTIAFSLAMSLVLLKLVDVVLGLRVSEHHERVGLDLTQHKESGYTLVN